jgi:signal peptidase II
LSVRTGVWLRTAAVLAVVVIADQVSKSLVRSGIEAGEERHVLPLVHLVHIRNTGVAFGAFAGGGIVVGVLVALALVALLAYFATHQGHRLVWLPTGLLLGGSMGNIADRLRAGGVTDFVKLPHWPAFNVADMAITSGVLALLWVIEAGERGPDDRTG